MEDRKQRLRKGAAACLAVLFLASCGGVEHPKNLIPQEQEETRVVNMFSPMEKIDPDAENVARTASDLTVAMAEEALGTTMVYRTYTAETYQDKTYDEVCLDRARDPNANPFYFIPGNPTFLHFPIQGCSHVRKDIFPRVLCVCGDFPLFHQLPCCFKQAYLAGCAPNIHAKTIFFHFNPLLYFI